MSKQSDVVGLATAGMKGDREDMVRQIEQLIARERSAQNYSFADQLQRCLGYTPRGGTTVVEALAVLNGKASNLLAPHEPKMKFDEMLLPDLARQVCSDLFVEHRMSDQLEKAGLSPRHRVLLVGPPGNGKTTLAGAIALELGIPMFVVRYDQLIDSYLGNTSKRLEDIFAFVRQTRCVVFFDECESIASERESDTHEVGEMKRVVGQLLLGIDALPSHTVAIWATNHPGMLDRAVWRRFQLRIELPVPTAGQFLTWRTRLLQELGVPSYIESRWSDPLSGSSFSQLEDFRQDVLRNRVTASWPGDATPEWKIKRLVSLVTLFMSRYSGKIQ